MVYFVYRYICKFVYINTLFVLIHTFNTEKRVLTEQLLEDGKHACTAYSRISAGGINTYE